MVAWARESFLFGLLGIVPLQISAVPLPAAQTRPGQGFAPGQVLVGFRDGLSDRARRDAVGECGPSRVELLYPLDVALVTGSEHSPTGELTSHLRRCSDVVWAEPNYLCRVALAAPNDPAYHELIGDLYVEWPAHFLDALAAWSRYPGCYFDAVSRPQQAPIVAVIDTGIDPTHPDFMNPGANGTEVPECGQLLLSLSCAFLNGGSSAGPGAVTDEHGHGTHLAGLIAAGADNGITAGDGVAGIGYHARLLPLKVAGANGVATHADIARAIAYAAGQGASVILIGFAGPTWSETLQHAVDYAWDRGCFIVAPGGDSGTGAPVFPAACPHVFAVAALTASGSPASYSSCGDHVALAAPGGDEITSIYSTLPTYPCTLRQDLTGPAYGWAFGTSQAAAHVAAAAGLYAGCAGLRPETGDEAFAIWQALQQSAAAGEPTPVAWSRACGYGTLAPAGLLADATPGDGLGGIVGRVLLNGSPAVGALVTAVSEEAGASVAVEAQWPTGAYRVPNLAPSVYALTAQAEGLSAVCGAVTVLPGCDTPGVDFRLGDPPPGAALTSAGMPAAAVCGQTAELLLTFANTGASTWRRADGYRLEQASCESAISDDPAHVDLAPGEAVAPGSERTFAISLPVPEEIGFYETAWRMSQQGGAGPFGDIARGIISVTSFLDVPADHWAVCEIEATRDAGIVQGYGGYFYRPASSVSRDQMAVYVARAMTGGDEEVPTGPARATFVDVGVEHWAYPYVEYAHEQGVVEGYPDGYYHPEYLLDRGQMAVFIARSVAGGEAGLGDYLPPETPTFPDVPAELWFYAAVEYLTARGVICGYPDDLYHPEYICSRDQVAVYVARAFGLI
ncbi:MAG: S8 family serine peptidase [Armatimonadota bacterium]|nr:MAG: S8 family serine peptidase [Armatimonadota bacterium]